MDYRVIGWILAFVILGGTACLCYLYQLLTNKYDDYVKRGKAEESASLQSAEEAKRVKKRQEEAVQKGAAEAAEEAKFQKSLQELQEQTQVRMRHAERQLQLEAAAERLKNAEAEVRARYKPSVPAPPAVAPLVPAPPAMVPHLTDRQIDQMAMKALSRIGNLPPWEQEEVWQAWGEDLEDEYGPNVAAEVRQRASHLRSLAGN